MRWPDDPDLRRRMVEGLLDWVAGLEAEDPLPEGVDPALAGPVPDLHGAVAALESLRREVGLQGRAFRQVSEAVRETADRVERAREEERAAPKADPDEERRAGRREVLSRLLDARDRAARVYATALAVAPRMAGGFPGGSARREAFSAVSTALRMHVEAMDEALRDLDCREIPALGRPFDPARMRAVEAARPDEGEPGRVVEVVRAGFFHGDGILRPAEVRVVPGVTGGGEA
jgi:molecular chaperone GrpE